MKYVTLLAPAHIAGQLRHPHDGAIEASDAEADRLISENLAKDVTDDFAEQAAPAKGSRGAAKE